MEYTVINKIRKINRKHGCFQLISFLVYYDCKKKYTLMPRVELNVTRKRISDEKNNNKPLNPQIFLLTLNVNKNIYIDALCLVNGLEQMEY